MRLIPYLALAASTAAITPDRAGAQDTAHVMRGSHSGDSLPSWTFRPSTPTVGRMTLLGDQTKHEMFVVRYRYPAGFMLQPHWHNTTVHATVLSGRIHVGMGDVVDSTKAKAYGPGSFIVFEGGMVHFEYFTEETILHVEGVGPFRTTFVAAPSAATRPRE